VSIAVTAVLAYLVALLSSRFCASIAGVSPLEIRYSDMAASGNVAIMTRVNFHEKNNATPKEDSVATNWKKSKPIGWEAASWSSRI